MHKILVYDDYKMHRLGPTDKKEYEEVTTEKATRIDITDVAKGKGKLLPFGRTYQNTKILPEGYTQLDYIESEGNAFITTNIVGLAKWKLKAQATNTSSTSSNILVGRNSQQACWFGANSKKWGLGSTSNSTIDATTQSDIDVDFNSPVATATINNETVHRNIASENLNNMYKLFDCPNGNTHFYFLGRLWKAQCYQNNVLVGYFVPCKNSNNEVGLYDLVSNTFYVSEGTSSFIAGTEVSVPNPNYPQDIQNVEGRSCRNLFNKDTITTGYRIVWATGSPYADSSAIITDYIEIETNTPYIFSSQTIVIGYDINKEYLGCLTDNGFIKNQGGRYSRINVDDSNVKFIRLLAYVHMGSIDVDTFQVNEGSILLPYEEYFEGKRLEFNVCNKNLFNSSTTTPGVIYSSGSIMSSNIMSLSDFIDIHNFAKITISGDTSAESRTWNSCFFDKDKNVVSGGANGTISSTMQSGRVFTIPDNAYYIRFCFANSWKDIMVEASEVKIIYEEHKQQLIPFPLAEGQKLMEGDYLADDGVHHVRRKIVFDGTENWNFQNSCFTLYINEYAIKSTNTSGKIIVQSNKYVGATTSYRDYIKDGTIAKVSGANNQIAIKDTKIENTANWKAWLAEQYANGTPVIIEYELEQEIVDLYTPAQAEAYNKLMNLKLYKGVNHIWTETDGLEPNLQLTYKRLKQEGVLQVSNTQQLNNLELNNTEETPEELDIQTPEENEVM